MAYMPYLINHHQNLQNNPSNFGEKVWNFSIFFSVLLLHVSSDFYYKTENLLSWCFKVNNIILYKHFLLFPYLHCRLLSHKA